MIQTNFSKISNARCVLGEGLLWDHVERLLLFVDIGSRLLYRHDLRTGNFESWKFNDVISWVQLTTISGLYLIGFDCGIGLFNAKGQANVDWILLDFPGDSDFRLNDSFVDSTGLLWFGSMKKLNPVQGGKLASFSLSCGLVLRDEGYGVTNGPLELKSSSRLLHNDSSAGITYVYDICKSSRNISNKRIWKEYNVMDGQPDGMAEDTDGNIWIAMWGSGMLFKLNSTGLLLRKFELPAKNVSNVCFGGDNLDRLFVTTAQDLESSRKSDKYQGFVYEITEHSSKGYASMKFDLKK